MKVKHKSGQEWPAKMANNYVWFYGTGPANDKALKWRLMGHIINLTILNYWVEV